MSKLDPDLKRLLQWAQQASPAESETAPFGLAGRVLASRRPAQTQTLFYELQRSAWGLSWVSVALIVCGAVVLLSQFSAPPPTGEFSSALGFLASNFPQ
jgi:hypothetical protein